MDKSQHEVIVQRLTCLKDSSIIQTGVTLNLYHSGPNYDGNKEQSFFFIKNPAQADQLFEVFKAHPNFSFEECRAYIRIALGIKEPSYD